MLELKNICKSYESKQQSSEIIFKDLNFNMGKMDSSIAIVGRSGSGKTTLLNIMAGLDTNYSGEYLFEQSSCRKNNDYMSKLRLQNFGMITQKYYLLNDRTVFNNVAISLRNSNLKEKEIKNQVEATLEKVGLADYRNKSPRSLSGGESQRVAIARAIVKRPKLLLADEPTGALDEKTEESILSLFSNLINEGNKMIIVTHSKIISDFCTLRYEVTDKRIQLLK
ncbi:hypothetical protein A5880_002586 [Enterococcus sp. 4G2_DIV0659]|uniref:ABC transporter domain-containing protein n=1 Tax=Candidatus Enterococcus mansonii TaxID=1834181 RepID=A0A242CJ41_9ENTE|nr:ABC transporter ATP-binding protein [Enterococcus sp. 4G2_DIV0659]OTO09802.1 hypothetical protein A5880_000485 [Enterococcus sp. 4G2_DIV0659]